MADKSSSKGSNGTFYHIKDFVYIESSPSQPYRIAQIAGFKPGPNSTVVVRCRFYDRPRDVEPHWLRKLNAVSEKFMYTNDFHIKNFSSDMSQTEKKRRIHQFKLRELIGNTNGNSESDEAYINASYIRGKCRIYRYIDVETIDDYIQHEDTFFYLASFEDEPKHLALEGEDTISKIARYSKCVNVGDFVAKPKPAAENEDIIWDGVNGGVSDHEFDSFLSIVRAVGLSARALDMGRRVGDSSLQTSLAYSFRDSTQYMAYFLLHTSNYDSNMAVSKLLVDGSPVMCSDQLEMWSSDDINFFYDELKKEKNFYSIYLKNREWKTTKQMIEFYYMNKVTESYMANKKERLSRKLSTVNQIFIPDSESHLNLNLAAKNINNEKAKCEGCSTKKSNFWFPWNSSKKYLICAACWLYWKKYGGLKFPHVDDGIKGFDSSYNCDLCCIAYTNKTRFNRHMANHYSHSCHHPGCHQKFSTPQKVEEHAKYIHGLMPHTPDPANTKNIFFFKATKRWKELRNELCKYAVYMKPICRKKSYSYDKAIGNYEGKIPIKAKKQIKDLRLLAEELRKRSTSSAYTSSPPCTEPPEKIPPP